MQNSVLTSSTATNRLILRKSNPKILNVNNTPVKTILDSSLSTRITKLLAINSNYYPLTQNLVNNNTTLFPVTKYYGNPMRVVGSIPYI